MLTYIGLIYQLWKLISERSICLTASPLFGIKLRKCEKTLILLQLILCLFYCFLVHLNIKIFL